jgi:hypothetical protein
LNTGLYFESAWYWLPLCFLLGASYAALLYFNEKKVLQANAQNKFPAWAMATLRFLVISIIAILLMSPFLKMRFSKTQKPAVVLLNDVSESVKNSFSKQDSAFLAEQVKDIKNQLSTNFEVFEYCFSDKIIEANNCAYNGKSTNISAALNEVNDRFLNRNLGAVLLISDGIYNQGENPIYANQDFPASIFTVALGDTSLQRDLKIANVLHNKTANINEQIPLKIEVEAGNLAGKVTELKVFEVFDSSSNALRFSKLINIGSQQSFQSFDVLLYPSKAGIVHYKISVSELDGETTFKNNSRDVFIEVLENKEQILIVYHSPHPDVAALKTAIETNKAFAVKTTNIEEWAEPLNNFSLIITHQLPSNKNKAQSLFAKAKELRKPILFVLGSQTAYNDLKALQQIVEINSSGDKQNEVAATFNNAFTSFTLQNSTIEAISKFPPIAVAFGNFKLGAASNALLFQRINSVNTDFPLIALSDAGETKQGIICGEGIWRWRLYDFLQHKSHNTTNELITKMVQLLCVKDDKRPFSVQIPKNIFNENEQVTFDAKLFNANYELVNQPEVSLTLKNSDGKVFDFNFARTENAYSLNVGNLPVGSYTYSAKTSLGNKNFSAAGKFSVSPLQLESTRTKADYELMTQLAAKHNGKVYDLKNMKNSAEDILKIENLKPIIFDTYLTENAINLKWIFTLIVVLLSAEWLYRKYIGAY